MTFGGLHPFIKTQVETLGLKEWKDGFNTENIPSSVINGSFHVMVGAISGSPGDHTTHAFRAPVVVRLFFKGYRDPQAAKDAALDKGQAVLGAILKPSVRLQQDGLKDIRPVSIQPVPLAQTNDNAVVLEIALDCFLIYRFT